MSWQREDRKTEHTYPSAEQREALALACEAFATRAKLVPLPKELKRTDLARVGFAVHQYRRGLEWPSRGLASDRVGMAALVYAMAGAAAHAAELMDEMLPDDEGWKSGYLKAREIRDALRSAVWPFDDGLPDA